MNDESIDWSRFLPKAPLPDTGPKAAQWDNQSLAGHWLGWIATDDGFTADGPVETKVICRNTLRRRGHLFPIGNTINDWTACPNGHLDASNLTGSPSACGMCRAMEPAKVATCKAPSWCGDLKSADPTDRDQNFGHVVRRGICWCSNACAEKHAKNLSPGTRMGELATGVAPVPGKQPAVSPVAITCKHGDLAIKDGAIACVQCADDRCRAFDKNNPNTRCSPVCYAKGHHVEPKPVKAKPAKWKAPSDGHDAVAAGFYVNEATAIVCMTQMHLIPDLPPKSRLDLEIERSAERVRRFR